MAAVSRVHPGNHFVEFSRDETEQSIAERFEKQVRKNPHRIAVQTDRVQLTYDDFNRSANRLARVCLEQSRDDRPVAILMEHGAPAIVAIFGALKASKIFILLDPALPDARIGQILRDSGSNVIITNDQSLGTAVDLIEGSRRVVNVDRCDTGLNSDNLNLAIRPDSIAYILYTSGSTGNPKGVIRTHRNDLRNVRHVTHSLSVSNDDRITLLGSYSTGQGMTDMCCALLNGATLFPRNLKTEGFNGLADWLMRERITFYHSAATIFRHFVHNLSGYETFPELRIVRLGGEPVSWKDVQSYKRHFSENCVLANELSSSEASTFSQFLVNKRTEINLTVPVGYPVEDKEVLILDEKGDQLEPGQIGEIAVRSHFLSPGYWNRPDLTELAFIEDRESQARRIYRTGDLGRKSADGCLEHLGRKDTQIKIRGYRVECYEIELALLQNPGVDQAFVTHRENAQGEFYLVAYIVPNKGAVLTVKEMRAGLTACLPEYMVPKAFVFLGTLPLTPTGKIDRCALPEPRTERPPLDVPCVAPRGLVEESVAKLCSQILNISVIGVHDNLFDLGGNSLAAMQIVARVMKTFRVNVPLTRFYESPTIAGLSAIIATSHEPEEHSEESGISIVPRDCPPPVSYFQERLWFMEQWDPGKSTYNFCQAYRLKGPLDVRAIEKSFNTVIERHEVLRTSFIADHDRPLQIIAPILRLPLVTHDLRTLPEAERQATSLHLAQEDAQRSFDLAQGPLLRALLVQLADEEHLLVLTVHQIVCDGWSMRILLSEFWTSYEAICRDKSPSLPTLFAQYSDFAIWQRQLLNEDWLQSQIAFWKETLGGTLPVLALPTDYPRPALQSFRGSRVPFGLPESLTEALNELSRQEEVTLFMTLMAAFKTLLFRYTGQEDLIVGFPIADRLWGEATGSIGFFVNTLVARTVISGKPTFKDFLLRVRDVCLSVYAHQDLPFEKLVEVLRPLRDLSRNPLFQVMFTFQNVPLTYPVPPEVCSTPISIDNGTSKVDLTLSLAERDSQLIGFFEYCTDLFDRATIERMADHFRTLLECIVADRSQPITKLSLLTEIERHQLLANWNDTKTDYSSDLCIHEIFESQVEKTPDSFAVEYEEKKMTYRELNSRANQLAHYLRGLGVGPETLAGICLERSVEMVVALLGVLKAGGAYLPLEPAYPTERLQFMLADARVPILLTLEGLEDGERKPVLSKAEGMDNRQPQSSILDPPVKVVCLDRDGTAIARESKDNPNVSALADGLAYVIYTSGSTGTPKGVGGLQRGAINRFAWMWNAYPFRPNEKSCVKTSLSFVDSVWEVFGPLLQGVPLVLIPDDVLRDPQRLIGTLRDHHVTRIGLVPSLLKTLLDTFPIVQDHVPELKVWCCSGEILPKEVVERFRKSLPDATLLNLYGSTEVSADVTCCDTRTANSNRVIPIGWPLSNTQIYILDANMELAPIGVVGELYAGGYGLARGYLNRTELTAEKFVANPFSDGSGSRLYRTGDLARYLLDGNIEFRGRIDSQVKTRGYRIELGEIESVLNQHPAVRESAVIACDEAESDTEIQNLKSPTRLVAYIVATQQPVPTVTELRTFLSHKLPDYMVPSVFVSIEALPLTPNGKIDRNGLPPPDVGRPDLHQGFVEPRTKIEELVAGVWREVLKLDKIGVYDNFFELGGHSLLATRVVARLRANFDVDLPLRKLFELPTVAALAEHVDFLRREHSGVSIPPIVSVSRDRPMPLSFSQRRLWFLHKLDPGLTAYNIPATFRIKGFLNVAALQQALHEIIQRHESLRTRILEANGQPFQEVIANVTFTLPVIDLSRLTEEQSVAEIQRLVTVDAAQSYDFDQVPLMRAKLLRLGDEDHVLIFNFHHIIADGSSLIVFYQELAALYEAFIHGKLSPLAPLVLHYADYSVWQQSWFHGEVFASEIAYWKRQLSGGPLLLKLPLDYERPARQSDRGARQTLWLSEELTRNLKELSRREGVTLFMTLLTAFDVLLSRHTGQEDIVVGSTIAGRGRAELDGLIGFFINAVALRADLSGNPTFLDLLKRVREVCLDAYTHQDVPFERVVEEINPQRDLGHNPIFQVMFNMADISERILSLYGCETAKIEGAYPGSKFDLVLHAPETDKKLGLTMAYNADLFGESRIAVLLEQFRYLLLQVVESPQKTLDQYSLVTPSAGVLLPDATEPLDDSWEGSIQQRISQQADRMSHRLAVVDAHESWTYQELDTRGNQLANHLRASGIQPGEVVAIYAHRSAPLVLALLGVLKAGAVFLILDPDYPASRLIQYLRIARPKGWLQMRAAGELPEEVTRCLDTLNLRCRVLLPRSSEEINELLRGRSKAERAVVVHADDPAYIAFTSGSTGQPKGVLCRHGPITHFLPWQEKTFNLRSTDRFCLLSGLAYNYLQRDVFTALWLGSTVYVPAPERLQSPDQLGAWLRQHEITVLHLTPASGHWLRTSSDQKFPLIRRIFLGGDALTRRELMMMHEIAPNATFVNLYGATETQRASSYWIIDDEFLHPRDHAKENVPVGHGAKDVQLLLLTPGGQLAGIGELGELYVRSPHLAAGYIGDEELTREKFLSNPFGKTPSDRVYRTGEFGRYLPNGDVEWAGRKDRRINIRGFRLELEEVETVLKQHPTVRDAAVIAWGYEEHPSDNPKSKTRTEQSRNIANPDKRLVAYLVSDEVGQSLIDLLRSFLSSKFPGYMVPSDFIIIDRLPLSPNGKVDYPSLLPPDQFLRRDEVNFAAPRTELERELGKILSEILGKERIGREDNFFHLGGHSLSAAQASARIRERFGVALDLRLFFDSPTIAELAQKLELLIGEGKAAEAFRGDEREEIEL